MKAASVGCVEGPKLKHRSVMVRSPTQGRFQFSGRNVHSNCFYDARDQLEAGANVKWSKFYSGTHCSVCQSNQVTEKMMEIIKTLEESSDEMKDCTLKKEEDQRLDWWTHNPCVEIMSDTQSERVGIVKSSRKSGLSRPFTSLKESEKNNQKEMKKKARLAQKSQNKRR